MPRGSPGWVRSSACIWVFSSQQSTTALSGGARYSPITSQNFASKCLSLDSLNWRFRCGLMSLAAHSRCTLAFEMPAAAAMVRQLQRPRCAGGLPTVSSTRLTFACESLGLRPRPGASASPAKLRCR